MGVETTKKSYIWWYKFTRDNLENTRYENRLQIIMPQILPPLYSETFKLQTTIVMWKGVPNHDYLLYKSFLKEFRVWMYMHQEGLKKKCFGVTNIFIWKKIYFQQNIQKNQ